MGIIVKQPAQLLGSRDEIESTSKKPRLVFFQWNHATSPKFLQLHMQLHVKCLSEFFEVILINEDCDYEQVCDKYQPDLTLFESGFKTSFSRKISFKNIFAFPEIPKLGLHNGDPWCDCRPGFLSDMEHWGVETFFTICTTTAEHTPEIAEKLFVWPNFIDSDVYRDYGQSKVVPVLFTGSMTPLYPWRHKISKIIANNYPSMTVPHLGYENRSKLMIYGEQYARTINAAWFVPACGSIAKDLVRKHFEIPGCKTCLITQKTPSVEAAGFVDMHNCIFANGEDVRDKLDYLFSNTPELEWIINNGYEFIHSSHTSKQRDQIFQWFSLNKGLKPNEKIIQSNPFQPLKVVQKSAGFKNTPIRCDGLHLAFLKEGDEKLLAGKYNEAEAAYLECLNYISSMCEPKLKLAICSLHRGDVKAAHDWIIQPIQYNLGLYGSHDSEPVEWAYYIIVLLCQGKLDEAMLRASQFPSLNHIELYRARWITGYLYNKDMLIMEDIVPKARYSIHQLPQNSFEEWIDNVCRMLTACKQFGYAELLASREAVNGELTRERRNLESFKGLIRKQFLLGRMRWTAQLNYRFKKLGFPPGKKGLPSINISDYIFRIFKMVKMNMEKR